MANYNLTSQQIKDTYEQLGQVSGSIEGGVSGSAVVDGTGSRINTLHVTASQATSASFATTALSASYAPGTGVTSIIAGTGISVDQATGNVTVSNTQGAAATGSLLVTSSATNNVITFTKGDGSTYTNTIDTGSGGGSAFPFTGSAGISGSLSVTGNTDIDGTLKVNGNTEVTGSFDATSTISSKGGSIQALGGGGMTVGNSGYALQYPAMNVYTNSGSYGGQIYGSHRITDLSGNNDVGILALSTFNTGDPGRICFETQFNSDVVWWISENENRFHVEKEVKAKAGLQVTGSVNINGTTNAAGNIVQTSGNIQSLASPGSNNISVGSSGLGLQYPSMQVYTDSGSFGGGVYGAYNLTDLTTGSGSVANMGLSSYNASAPGELSFETQLNGDIVWWISKNENRFHVEKGLKAKAGAQITGSVNITGSTDINGTLSLPGITDVSASIAAGGGGGSAFPFTGSAGITGSLTVDGATVVTGSFDATSTITSKGGSIQALGGGGMTVGNSGYALQYPSMNVYTNSGSYGGQIYGSHRITDLSGNGDVGIIALSTFNSGDSGRICFETQFNNDVVWWISENKNLFHVEKEIKAIAGLQATGSVNITGSTDIDGVLSLPGITNVSASIASGGGAAFPFTGSAQITGSLTITGSAINNIATPSLAGDGGGFNFTASIDFSQANMFNLPLDNGTTYHFAAVNITPGQTATLRVPQGPDGNGQIEWSPDFKFPGGSAPTATTGTGAEDIYTFAMYDTGSVYAVQTADLS